MGINTNDMGLLFRLTKMKTFYKFIDMTVAQLYEYIKNHRTVHFQQVDCMAREGTGWATLAAMA